MRPYLDNRRVFFSACELATERLAKELLTETDCYSVVAPAQRVEFGQAVLFWASLYHLMFRKDKKQMKRAELSKNLLSLSEVFGMKIRFLSKSSSATKGFREVTLGGQ